MRCAAYARVSRAGQTTDSQLSRLREYARHNECRIAAEDTFVDEAVSGRLSSRPAFDRLRDAIRERRFGVVLVVKLDRIARSVRTALEFFDEADAAGVRVIVTDQGFDTGTPSGRLVRTMLAAVAEFETELIRERTLAAMDEIRSGRRRTRSGRPPGRPRKVTPELRARILALRRQGKTWNEIARSTHLPAGTCRKVPAASRSESPFVEKGRPEFATPTAGTQPQTDSLGGAETTVSEQGAPE
jgi:DNA invertase Pin-like site-specific DNA recombinase